MSKFIVVSVHRDRWSWPVLTVRTEKHVTSETAGKKYITDVIMAKYEKRCRGKMGMWASMRIVELRIVDALGLKRLLAAAKASRTVRRKRAGQKAAATRAKNKAKIAERVARMNAARLRGSHGEMKSPVMATEFYPVFGEESLN